MAVMNIIPRRTVFAVNEGLCLLFPQLACDAEGDIPLESLAPEQGYTVKVRAALYAGRFYTPGSHEFTTEVTIEHGRGLFRLGPAMVSYRPGAGFLIGAHISHGFIRVDEPTVFIKRVINDLRH